LFYGLINITQHYGRQGAMLVRMLVRMSDLRYLFIYMTGPSSIGELEFVVLLVVSSLGDGAYGAEIRRDVSARTGRDYSTGAIYASLQRLEEKGFLASYESEPLPVRGGRARRYFTLSTTGRSALRKAIVAKQRLWEGVSLVPRRGT